MADQTLALSKYADPADFAELAEELVVVDRHFTAARPQHPMRRWEYAMALRAYDTWAQRDYEQRGHANRMHGGTTLDVGGAGSPFSRMISDVTGGHARVVDPDEPGNGLTLEQHLRCRSSLAHHVFCLSVLEHIPPADLDRFLYHLSCLTAPGGLLFLTVDACACTGLAAHEPTADPHHFHWMRQQIFTRPALLGLWTTLTEQYHFQTLGSLTYSAASYAPQVYDYTFASLALVKRS